MANAPKISPARTAAFDVLRRIEKERAFSSVALPQAEEGLSEKDRALCHEITLGVLRKQFLLGRYISEFATGKRIDPEVRLALRMGLYQLLFLDRVPPYSVINESVNLVARAKKVSAKGFVNAILRQATRGIPELHFAGEADRVSTHTSHPRWLIAKWVEQFGESRAFAIAAANNAPPRITFRVVDPAVESEMLKQVADITSCEFTDGCYVSNSFGEELRRLAESGRIYLQDQASQLVAASIPVAAGESFLDICAAPGGKTTSIARRVPGAVVVSGDIHLERVRQIRRTFQLQQCENVEVLQYDAEYALPFDEATFDVVLVDAPCTGTGTIRHNPEIALYLDEDVFTAISEKQLNILRNASKSVKPGGSLVYSTCSLEIDENEGVCGRFLDGNSDFEPVAVDLDRRFITDSGYARTFPDRDGMDGFFIAHFRRK